jgi:hypothetical protein
MAVGTPFLKAGTGIALEGGKPRITSVEIKAGVEFPFSVFSASVQVMGEKLERGAKVEIPNRCAIQSCKP